MHVILKALRIRHFENFAMPSSSNRGDFANLASSSLQCIPKASYKGICFPSTNCSSIRASLISHSRSSRLRLASRALPYKTQYHSCTAVTRHVSHRSRCVSHIFARTRDTSRIGLHRQLRAPRIKHGCLSSRRQATGRRLVCDEDVEVHLSVVHAGDRLEGVRVENGWIRARRLAYTSVGSIPPTPRGFD